MVKKPNGYWKNWENIERELNNFIKENKRFPLHIEIKSQFSGIVKQYNINELREKMGYEPSRKPNGYWNEEIIKLELEKFISESGKFPKQKEFNEKGRYDLFRAIARKGGLSLMRESMGYCVEEKPNKYWSEWNNIETGIKEVIKEIGHFPTQEELKKFKGGGLTSAIHRNHNGLQAVREKMGYISSQKPNGYWKNWENIEREIKEVISEIGHFPTYEELKKFKGAGLTSAISKNYKGIRAIREKMGYLPINSNKQFLDFLSENKPARNLAGLAINLNGNSYDIEKTINELYGGKFKDQGQLHKLLQENSENIHALIEKGMTNLGAYLGEFSLGDRRILPIILGEALMSIPEESVTQDLEERLVKVLRTTYSPRFNDNAKNTMNEIKGKVQESNGKVKGLYDKLKNHYQKILNLEEELNG